MNGRAISRLGIILFLSFTISVSAQNESEQFTNLQVLPKDVSRRELMDSMLENLRGLGLPRRQNEGCLHCHVGNMEQPVDTWDFASDEKLAKRKARDMMAMVAAINDQHLAALEERITPPVGVTCYTCHAGRTDPRPLSNVLRSAHGEGGIDNAIARYRELKERYSGADAYDFRPGVLAGVAMGLANDEAFEDAIALAELEIEIHPSDPQAKETLSRLGLERTVYDRGVDEALSEFESLLRSDSEVGPGLLDGLGWRLYRRDRRKDALAVFRRNLEQFPDEYIPNESLADALWFTGEQDTAIQMLEEWLERHPDHTMARRRLTNLRAQR